MSESQVQLLRRLIIRYADANHARNARYACLEVGWINGINPRTADALIKSKLAIDTVFLGTYDPPPDRRYIRLAAPLWYEDPDEFMKQEGLKE